MSFDMDSDEGEDYLNDIVETTKENRIAAGTRKNYEAKVRLLCKFILDNCGVDVDEDDYNEIILFLNDHPAIMDRFVAFYSYKDPENSEPRAP